MISARMLFIVFYFFINHSFGQKPDSAPSTFCADSVKKPSLQWANFGLGNSTENLFNSLEGFNISINYHWKPKRITYLAGASATTELLNYDNTLYVVNGGIGKSISKRRYLLSLVAGPGLMWGRNDDNSFVKPGISINAEIVVKVIKGMGLGLEIYSNLNSLQSSTGARVVIHLNNDK